MRGFSARNLDREISKDRLREKLFGLTGYVRIAPGLTGYVRMEPGLTGESWDGEIDRIFEIKFEDIKDRKWL